jgi:hypothetical protein
MLGWLKAWRQSSWRRQLGVVASYRISRKSIIIVKAKANVGGWLAGQCSS